MRSVDILSTRVDRMSTLLNFLTALKLFVQLPWLRQKLEDKADSPKHILTVRGEGYRFVQ